jgi:hypothetical protein
VVLTCHKVSRGSKGPSLERIPDEARPDGNILTLPVNRVVEYLVNGNVTYVGHLNLTSFWGTLQESKSGHASRQSEGNLRHQKVRLSDDNHKLAFSWATRWTHPTRTASRTP